MDLTGWLLILVLKLENPQTRQTSQVVNVMSEVLSPEDCAAMVKVAPDAAGKPDRARPNMMVLESQAFCAPVRARDVLNIGDSFAIYSRNRR